MLIRSRAPLRLGMAGGGTDVSPYCDIYGGNVLSGTIDRYSYATIRTLENSRVRFVATDIQKTDELDVSQIYSLRGILDLHHAVYNRMVLDYNNGQGLPIEITTYTEAPIGSGLGSSSTMVVAMIKAFAEFLNLQLDNYKIADLAFQIERIDCKFDGGRQDHYSAAFGGINFLEFGSNGKTTVTPLELNKSILNELESSLILCFTGVSRESSKIINEQSTSVHMGSRDQLEAMHSIKSQAQILKEAMMCGNTAQLINSIQLGWEAKKMTSKSITNNKINAIYESAIHAGALAGKISGAGGGGYLWFFAPLEKKERVLDALTKLHCTVSSCHFTDIGAESWRTP